MKVKYCSWDVRELAADWGWLELSDSRDRLSPLFRSPDPHSLLLSVNVDSGLVTVYTEDDHSFRNVVFCQTLFQFEEVEKLFQLDHSFSHLISSKAEPKYVSSQESLDRKIKGFINSLCLAFYKAILVENSKFQHKPEIYIILS